MISRMTLRRGWLQPLTCLFLLVSFGLAACQPIQPEVATDVPAAASVAIPQITIKAQDYAFEMPEELPSGLVSLTLVNEGQVNHHALMIRLNEGITFEQVIEALQLDAEAEGGGDANEAELYDLLLMMPDTDPGASNEATVELAPGNWVIFSASMEPLPGEEPMPDWARGSIAQFTVVESTTSATAPEADLVLTIGSDKAEMSGEISAGTQTIQVVNESGAEETWAFFLRLEGGISVEDILAAFEALFTGQEISMEELPVFHVVGGLMDYNLGNSFYTTIDFAPGDYAVITSVNAEDFPYTGQSIPFTVNDETGAFASQTIPEVTIEVNDEDFTIPADFPGGIVAVTVQNNTDRDLDIGFTRVREGASVDELIALADDFVGNLVPIMQQASFLVSLNPLPAGASNRLIMDFKAGQFVVDATDHVEGEPVAGAAHIYGTFEVSTVVGMVKPEADVTVDMLDFAYAMPDEIPAGEQVWEFVNSGAQWHMMFVLKPAEGASVEDVLAAIQVEEESSGPPPFEFVSSVGVPPISEGERAWLTFDMEPGTYVVGCPLPDMAALMAGGEPLSHLHHGMYQVITVTEN